MLPTDPPKRVRPPKPKKEPRPPPPLPPLTASPDAVPFTAEEALSLAERIGELGPRQVRQIHRMAGFFGAAWCLAAEALSRTTEKSAIVKDKDGAPTSAGARFFRTCRRLAMASMTKRVLTRKGFEWMFSSAEEDAPMPRLHQYPKKPRRPKPPPKKAAPKAAPKPSGPQLPKSAGPQRSAPPPRRVPPRVMEVYSARPTRPR